MDVYVVLPILYESTEYLRQKELGLDPVESRWQRHDVTFYSINAVAPNKEFKKDWTSIFSNGCEFLCPLAPEDVDIKIIDALSTDDIEL